MLAQHRSAFAALVLVSACAILFGRSTMTAQPTPPAPTGKSDQWKAVEQAKQKGLPKDAIAALGPIIDRATADGDHGEAVKAISQRVILEGVIQGNKAEEKITRMEAEIQKANASTKPFLQTVLANWYWHYFQQNRWRFLQRTDMDVAASDDFTEWSLPQILREIDAQFDQAFEGADILKKAQTSEFADIVDFTDRAVEFRPTMFDVLSHNALDFYSTGEQAGNRKTDAFELSAEGPIFDDVDAFLTWKPNTPDQDSLKLRAIRLLQDVIRFHVDDEDSSARLDADLARLTFGNNYAFGENKSARYKAALKRFADANAGHRVAARAKHDLAQVIHGEGEWVEAHRICTQVVETQPDTIGGNRCHNLIQKIEQKQCEITAERNWSSPWPTIDVSYRNVDQVFFRLVSFDDEAAIMEGRTGVGSVDNNDFGALLRRTAQRTWSSNLPPTADFKNRSESIDVPRDVSPGAYYLISSHREDFREEKNVLSIAEVWVTKLALVTRDESDGKARGFVLDADTGDPVVGAEVKAWAYHNRNRNVPRIAGATQPKMVALRSVRTDRNGRYEIPVADFNNVIIKATHDGHSVTTIGGDRYNTRAQSNAKYERTTFFTDRSIYRPGQTIRYKGICYEVGQSEDRYQTLAKKGVFVSFRDPNGKEIERKYRETNDYGSFEGSFTAPRDRLTGRMQISIVAGPSGNASIRVEEYKRPKFQVEVQPPEEPAKLEGNVVVVGKATGYTGASINDAKVSYRVVRSVRYPGWWYWRCWWMPPQNESQEITHGTTTTSGNGTFRVEFVAKPDGSVDRESEPTFQYQVFVDVTDTTGETRSSSRTIQVGYTTLSASLSAPSWLTTTDDVELSIRTATLDGQGKSATGKVAVHQLIQPDRVARKDIAGRSRGRRNPLGPATVDANEPPQVDPTNPNSWPLGEVAWQGDFQTDAAGNQKLPLDLKAGIYRAVLNTQDEFDNAVTAILPIEVIDPEAKQLKIRLPEIFKPKSLSVEPGDAFTAVWGSGYETARVFVEVEHRGRMLQSYWSDHATTQLEITQPVNESMRGGFTVRTTMVRENRGYVRSQFVNVPWSNKNLTIEWERFTDKLQPGSKETWTAIIRGADSEAAAAEMVATLYDASLDAYMPHQWMTGFNVFRRDRSWVRTNFQNSAGGLRAYRHGWTNDYRSADLTYPRLASELTQNFMGYQFMRTSRGRLSKGMAFGAAPEPTAMAMEESVDSFAEAEIAMSRASIAGDVIVEDAETENLAAPAEQPNLSNVSARKNLNETAFFFPQLTAGVDGSVRMEFTMPEALTEWKFIGFSHDRELRSGPMTDTVVTSKDLMVQPNPPRFLREGDVVEFTVKVSNLSPTRQTGTVRLAINSARTGDSVDNQIGNTENDQAFEVAAGESKTYSWRLSVPDSIGFLTYKAVASTGKLSDGEQGFLPVLSRRVLVTESLALPIRGKQTKDFRFDKLAQSVDSETLQHQSLTVQMVSNPSWYAVMALPYLMEFPHECSEQLFNRVYANALARKIVTSDPKIERVFEQWRATPALDSPLMKNQDLKAVLLEETPWFRQAQAESESRRNVGVLFEQNRLDDELSRALAKLADQQLGDGSWPWFPGGRGNDYITLYVTTGFGRLRHLGVQVDTAPAIQSLSRLDGWVTEMYNDIKVVDRDKNHLSTSIALYLYGRSFFLADQPVAAQHAEAVRYWVDQAETHWLKLAHRQSQAHLAIALKRFDKIDAARGIMESIRQRSVSDDELGMFWRDTELSWWWYHAPIETQAMMIEAFDEVLDDAQAVEDCKVWLLKQKQTQDWKTTKATADAIYALLLRGSDNLASDELVTVSMGGQTIEPADVEAGTGFYEQRFSGSDVTPELAEVNVTKVDDGVAWGSVHWQYLEDIAAVTAHEGTPLKLTKQLYVKKNTDEGPKLIRVDGAVEVGDELVVRIVLASDRDMEYLHLKDHRGSGTEPVNVLSRYRFQDGLAYYESTKDTASHFFIDYLPKGKYVFEYSTRVQLRGEYQTGLANIQCMYAPEFNSHSESLPIVVK